MPTEPLHKKETTINIAGLFLCGEVLIVLALAIFLLRIINDDTYITLRYARNLIHGHGFVYTPGEYVFGITNPLLAILESIFSLPALGNVLIGDYILQYSLLLGCVILAHRYFQDSMITAALIPLLFFNPQTIGYFGNEIVLILFLSLGALCCLDKKHDKLFAICLSLIYLARFDGFIFGFVASLVWFYRRRPLPIKKVLLHISLWASVPVVWHLFAYFYYGHFFPNSVTSKLFGSEHIKDYMTFLLEKHLPDMLLSNGSQFRGALIIAGLIFLWPKVRIYFFWFLAFSLVYWLIKAPGVYIWYFYTFTFTIIFCLAGGIVYIARKLFSQSLHVGLFIFLLSLIFIGSRQDYAWQNFMWEKQRYDLYRLVVEKLNPFLNPNSTFEMNEIGILGYSFDRPIFDEHFLVTPQGAGKNMFPPISQLREIYKPQFIVTNPYREYSPDELINAYPGYIYRTTAITHDKSIHVYIFERQSF
jgi:hypothetical protein